MVPPTRRSGQDALSYVIHSILAFPKGSPVDLALVNLDFNTISDLLLLFTDDIALLQYPKQTTNTIESEDVISTIDTPLPLLAQVKLRNFHNWAHHMGYVQDQVWLTFSVNDFNEFVKTGATSPTPSVVTTPSPTPDVEEHSFSYIKKDIHHYQPQGRMVLCVMGRRPPCYLSST